MKHNVILVGDNRLFLEGLSLIIEGDGLTIALRCNTSSDLPVLLAGLDEQPGLIVWDSSTADDYRIVHWSKIHNEFSQVGIVVLTDHIDNRRIVGAIEAGVGAVLPKCISANALKLTLKLVALGERLATFPINFSQLSQQIPATFQTSDAGELQAPLSQREAQILQRLRSGSSNREIALDLGIAEATIKVHIKSLMRKISVTNRTQAAVWSQTHQA